MSALDSATLQKMSQELDSLSPEARELVFRLYPSLQPESGESPRATAGESIPTAGAEVAAVADQAGEESQDPEWADERVKADEPALAQDDMDGSPLSNETDGAAEDEAWVFSGPRPSELAIAGEYEANRRQIAQLAIAERPAVRGLSPKPRRAPRHYATTFAACVVTAVATFFVTSSWRQKREDPRPSAVVPAPELSKAPLPAPNPAMGDPVGQREAETPADAALFPADFNPVSAGAQPNPTAGTTTAAPTSSQAPAPKAQPKPAPAKPAPSAQPKASPAPRAHRSVRGWRYRGHRRWRRGHRKPVISPAQAKVSPAPPAPSAPPAAPVESTTDPEPAAPASSEPAPQ